MRWQIQLTTLLQICILGQSAHPASPYSVRLISKNFAWLLLASITLCWIVFVKNVKSTEVPSLCIDGGVSQLQLCPQSCQIVLVTNCTWKQIVLVNKSSLKPGAYGQATCAAFRSHSVQTLEIRTQRQMDYYGLELERNGRKLRTSDVTASRWEDSIKMLIPNSDWQSWQRHGKLLGTMILDTDVATTYS